MAAENLWEVDIINRDTTGDIWTAQHSQIRLIHVNTSTVLTFTGKDYPDWGFLQSEVVTARSKNVQQADTVWNVEEHRYTVNDKDKETIERELVGHEMIPEADSSLSFWDKFLELQFKMMITYNTKVHNHNFASDPSEWPFLTRGVAYFIAKDSNRQVHLLGNLVVWYTGTLSLLLYCALLVFYLLRRQRLIYDIDDGEFTSYITGGEVFLSGYLFHYLPYYFCDRTVFLYDYLPAYIYKLMLTAHFLSHCVHLVSRAIPGRYLRVVLTVVTLAWMTAVITVFCKFSVLSYAHTPLTKEDVRALQWKDTWEFIVHRK